MSGIPPDVSLSAAQAPYAARDAARIRESADGARGGAGARQDRTVDATGEVVETSDRDTEVYTDAEGSGSQGRAFEQSAEGSPEPETRPADPDSATADQPHLDIQA